MAKNEKGQKDVKDNAPIAIPNARLSFPSLFEHNVFAGEPTGKYEATFILDKTEHAAVIANIQKAIAEVVKEKFKGKALSPDRLCLRDGDDTDREELAGKMTLKASNRNRPKTYDGQKNPVTKEDEVFYAGCYVNGLIGLWSQDNQFGRRINANLLGVMFKGHGEPFGAGQVDDSAFDIFEAEDDDDFQI